MQEIKNIFQVTDSHEKSWHCRYCSWRQIKLWEELRLRRNCGWLPWHGVLDVQVFLSSCNQISFISYRRQACFKWIWLTNRQLYIHLFAGYLTTRLCPCWVTLVALNHNIIMNCWKNWISFINSWPGLEKKSYKWKEVDTLLKIV